MKNPSVEDYETALRVLRFAAHLAADVNPSWHGPIVSVAGIVRGFKAIAKAEELKASAPPPSPATTPD